MWTIAENSIWYIAKFFREQQNSFPSCFHKAWNVQLFKVVKYLQPVQNFFRLSEFHILPFFWLHVKVRSIADKVEDHVDDIDEEERGK